ncbi:MAG: serine--tRNA ligase [bacterium]
MLDINLIRERTDYVRTALLKRMNAVDFTELLDWDRQRRTLITQSDELKARTNQVSKQISAMKKLGQDIAPITSEMKTISAKISELGRSLSEVELKIDTFLAALPNIPDEDVLPGGKENNQIIRSWGEKPVFDFEPRDHVALAEQLGLIDYKRGAKLGGSGYWIYRGNGSIIEWALLDYFITEHLRDGYEFMLPPHLLTYECGFTAGQFPKFVDDVFHIKPTEPDQPLTFLLPTAETALINFHRDEILREDELPRKYFAYTPCYRKEAGSYRTAERGMIRGHQFNKVEMFQYTTPETSSQALEELTLKAERLVQGLGLHYRVAKLAAGDCSAGMARTHDIEVWIPSMKEYKEVSSASNARDFQARRGKIRFRRTEGKKIEYVHTLNASGLATSRLLPAIIEQFQQKDGTVRVPDVLQKRVGKAVLTPAT